MPTCPRDPKCGIDHSPNVSCAEAVAIWNQGIEYQVRTARSAVDRMIRLGKDVRDILTDVYGARFQKITINPKDWPPETTTCRFGDKPTSAMEISSLLTREESARWPVDPGAPPTEC